MRHLRSRYFSEETAANAEERWGLLRLTSAFERLVWILRRLAETRLTIDRQSAELRGELLNADGDTLGQLRMQCEPRQADDLPEPKF